MTPLGTDSITRWRAPSTTDTYGNTVPDWHNALPATITGCSLQPLAPDEQHPTGREVVTSNRRLLVPAHGDLLAIDRVEHGGTLYEIDGDIVLWPQAWGGLSHLSCRLTVVVG